MNNKLKIVFMGTPDFAVATLKALVENDYNIVGVITSPDKPAGRGRKIKFSAVKEYALSKDLYLMQPEKLKNQIFLNELRALNVDLQIVVAFRMLPEIVWNMPTYGSVNLHGSLLPQYRGAAPINWAIINGDTETGVSTFFIVHKIDTGKLIFREKIPINNSDNVEVIHDKLMTIGANLMLKTVDAITKNDYPQIDQNSLIEPNEILREAPKIFKADCHLNWEKPIKEVYNLIRGLSPYPTVWTELRNIKTDKIIVLKIFETEIIEANHNLKAGDIDSDNKTYFNIAAGSDKNLLLSIKSLQLAGKKRLNILDFLKGIDIEQFEVKSCKGKNI